MRDIPNLIQASAREGRNTNDMRMSAQHQGVGHQSGNKAPGADFLQADTVAAAQDRPERHNRGLRGEGSPSRALQASALGIDRRYAGKRHNAPCGEEHEGSDIAVGDQMHERPDRHPDQERMARDSHNARDGRPKRPSWATVVGLGVVRPITANRNAGSMATTATGFHHSGVPQVA